MEMKRIEAETLEEAYSKAAKELACSVTEINYEIVQHPNTGMMGLFKKPAIIIAVKKIVEPSIKKEKPKDSLKIKNSSITVTAKKKVKVEEPKIEKEVTTVKNTTVSKLSSASAVMEDKNAIVDNFFNDAEKVEAKTVEAKKTEVKSSERAEAQEGASEVLDFDDDRDNPENREVSIEIENKLKHLISVACFEIDTVEVDVFNGIAHIFVDGEDAALLIGKEGYRYNALSYMLFNWINSSYDLYIKLEIAEFIQTQEEMIDNYLKPIAEHIIEHGRGKTKPLDGILVQIALEKLRVMFPNKYIAIKTGKDGKKFILINNFNSQKPN